MKKQLTEIKYGIRVVSRLLDPDPVTYDQLSSSVNISSKLLQKSLSDLVKYGFVLKTNRGYTLTEVGMTSATGILDEQERTT